MARTEEQNRNMEKWAEALRSQKYNQGQEWLRTDESRVGEGSGPHSYFCCLGVLCDISGLGQWVETDEHDGLAFVPHGEPDVKLATVVGNPPQIVMDYVGIDRDHVEKLVDMNDAENKSFQEIADYIEALTGIDAD